VAFFFAQGLSKISSAVELHLCGWRAKKEEGMHRFALSASIGVLFIASQIGGAATFQKIALSGEPAPGPTPGTTFATFEIPRIDAAGNVLFLSDDNLQRDGLWLSRNGTLETVARRGAATPGRTGTFTGLDNYFNMNAAGDVVFGAGWSTPGTSTHAYWTGKPGSLTIAVANGDPVPGMSQVRFEGFGQLDVPALDSQGQIAFVTDYSHSISAITAANDTAIWKWSSGSLVQVLREGDSAPGTEPGVNFGDLSIPVSQNPLRIAGGKVAVRANLTGPGTSISNNQGIWLGDGQTLTKIVRAGDPAPGGDRFGAIGFDSTSRVKLSVSDVGDVVFQARLVSGREGLFRSRNGVIEPIARIDDAAPGTGVSFVNVHSPVVNSSGKVAFWADIGTPLSPQGSLWTWSDGVLTNILTSTDKPPAMPAGFEFLRVGGTTQTQNFLFLNDNGQMAFGTGLREISTGASYSTLWGYDPTLGLQLLVGPRATLPGDTRNIGAHTFVDEREFDGRFSSLNSSGQLAVSLSFPIGGGIFLTAVPEPGSISILLAVGFGLIRRRRFPV
jgi:hypothetical protein